MSQKEIAFKIEELQIGAEQVHSLWNALYASIFHQDVCSKADLEWAFVLLGDMTVDMLGELQKLTDCAFENFRKEGYGSKI